MARSIRIYVVTMPDYDGCQIEAAFTVKREAKRWVKSWRKDNPLGERARALEIISLGDNNTEAKVHTYNEQEFMEA